ncbi:type II secretion system minor pseudopilin GspH [Candidatus Williamhamiltonella defendens]|uniref:Type II secretion system protein H n=1 Tax=Candidatus Hamiltonella defensa (Bemisia tabaci) TaxID=672795 RepID=A0A249DXY9_9ENTR|nr:type II secretion system minor pseudopilin GspH [Candidatus Hamiltonella defensa]ASX25767.1 type II secretion system protein GspH [Candidatus Hamiltonella defensa (Bemisia tabaci)]CED78948.1 General secretion pathway protein H [Candidatus Hamiltonella defensa (Bemisia tabaci)]
MGSNGFTLIESMLVIFLIGLMAAMILMTVPTKEKTGLKEEAKRFYRLLQLTQEESFIKGQMHGIRFYRHGYEIMRRKKGQWQRIKKITLPPDIFLRLTFNHTFEEPAEDAPEIFSYESDWHDETISEKTLPQIWLLGQSVIPAFELEFHHAQKGPIWAAELQENGEMNLNHIGVIQ